MGYNFFVHKDNKSVYSILCDTLDTSGRRAFNQSHLLILTYVGSFDPKRGCFASRAKMMEHASRGNPKTLDRNLKYLTAVGAITEEKIPNKGKIRRLAVPHGPVIPQKNFRRDVLGLHSYRYLDEKESEDESDMKDVPTWSDDEFWNSTQEIPALNNAKPRILESAQIPVVNCMSSENADEFDEPLLHKKKVRVPKNERERRAEAARESNKGHVINPIGRTSNRKKSCNWKLARDIGPTGSVTTPQLWRHLVMAYDKAFGSGILENMISRDKTALEAMFSNVKQAFIETCKYETDNRDLAEYFDWVLDPKYLTRILSDSDRFGNMQKNGPKIFHYNQFSGAVHVKRFYDKIIRPRLDKGKDGESDSQAIKIYEDIHKFFKEFEDAFSDDMAFCFKMTENGFALAAQFLCDEKELSESECRQHIIRAMSNFIKANKDDPQKAIDYLKMGYQSTKEHAILLFPKTSIWFDWEEKTKDLVDLAAQQAGVL